MTKTAEGRGKKKPQTKQNKTLQERKKSSPQTLATFKRREELNSAARCFTGGCMPKERIGIDLSVLNMHRTGEQIQSERKTESNCESIRKTRTIEEVMQP